MNRVTSLVLVAVFGLLMLYVILVQNPKDEAATNATPTPFSSSNAVWVIAAEQITSIHITDPRIITREVMLLKDPSGLWLLSKPTTGLADQPTVTRLVTQTANLNATTVITTASDLSLYGIFTPTATIELKLADGTTKKAIIGDKVPTGASYYLSIEGQSVVYVVGAYSLDELLKWPDTPPFPPPTPTPTLAPFAATLEALPTPTGTPSP